MNTPLILAEADAGPFAVFAGTRLVAHGLLPQVVAAAKAALDDGETSSLLIFDDATGRQVEVDMRGTVDEVMRRLGPAVVPRGPGRPKMGVAAREVTLLPRHWEWLAAQPGGASAA
ncbi:DUF2239 family protein, partial [Phenylobacterium sp.]|uniref:DUF2239 family protein n=1 Tax=Phenylobacterium sp. TaxID=1871053 RepID=UPI0027376F2C